VVFLGRLSLWGMAVLLILSPGCWLVSEVDFTSVLELDEYLIAKGFVGLAPELHPPRLETSPLEPTPDTLLQFT
jgi:hypothetical protein